MSRLTEIMRTLHEGEEGHVQPLAPALLAVGGAIALAVGAAEDSSIAAYIGGAVLALGIVATTVVSHQVIDYEIYDRLDKLEK